MKEKVMRPRPRKPVNTLRIAVAVSMTPDELQVLEEVATRLNVSRTQVMREALRLYLERIGVQQSEKEEGAGKEAGEKDVATQVSL